MKYCHKATDIPEGAHLVVLAEERIHIPGDERSRTSPGHGYPAEDKDTWNYIVFEDQEELQDWVERNLDFRHFVVLQANRLTVRKRVTVDISP